jgi:hypothetical protein
MARFHVARLPDDADVLERAHAVAGAILPRLDEPEHALIADALRHVEAQPVAA